VNGNQPCKQSLTSTVTLKELQYIFTGPNTYDDPLPMRGGEGWCRVGAEVAKWETKAMIHKAQLSLTLTQI